MQYIDNDMDELFKKAGENYPLRTDGANWDAVVAKLADSSEEVPIYPSGKANKNRNYLWLLLLLLIPLATIIYQSDHSANTQNNVQPANSNRASHEQGINSSNKNTPKQSLASAAEGSKDNGRNKDSRLSGETRSLPLPGIETVDNTAKSIDNTVKSREEKDVTLSRLKNKPEKGNLAGSHEKNNSVHNDPDNNDNAVASGSSYKEPVPVDSTTAIRQPKRIDSVSTNKADTAEVKKRQPQKALHNKSGFYFGVVAGPDISSIKGQKVTDVGYSAGAVLGYRINRHWAAEAGALWDEKKYYTKGEYFDKKGANIPSTVRVHYLDGGCNMLEFPVAVRYDLNIKKNSFFVTAGLTSYLMKKESYNYGADNNGNYYEGFKTYKNSGNHLFANFQFSAGYNYNLSRKLSLRIEPYIKMPLKNIGIGSMPISSKGIYIGIMRSIR